MVINSLINFFNLKKNLNLKIKFYFLLRTEMPKKKSNEKSIHVFYFFFVGGKSKEIQKFFFF